jgi:hypothetical protein
MKPTGNTISAAHACHLAVAGISVVGSVVVARATGGL